MFTDKTISEFYKKERPKATNFLKRKFSEFSKQDIDDVVSDSTVILCNNIKNGKYQQGEASLSTYFMSICKNQALSKNQQQKRGWAVLPLDDERALSTFNDSNVDYLLGQSSDRDQILDEVVKLVKNLPEPCGSILWSFYWKDFSMEEIADWEGYKNADVAKSKKSKCLSKLKEKVKQICMQNQWTMTE